MKNLLATATRPMVWVCLLGYAGSGVVYSQCPDTGETKVFQSTDATGYYFYKFQGGGSFRYFLEGKKFSLNDKDGAPGKTYLFIDDMAYEPLLIERAQLLEYTKSTNTLDILRAQAKYEQEHFKKIDPSMVIQDYGPTTTKNPDGSDNRMFYLWKKESAPGKTLATQYLASTVVKDGLFVMSFMPVSGKASEDDMITRILNYASHFGAVSSDQCAQVVAPSK
jgi:hypothetical protein